MKRIIKLLKASSILTAFCGLLSIGCLVNDQHKKIERVNAVENPVLVDSKSVSVRYNYTSNSSVPCIFSLDGTLSVVSNDGANYIDGTFDGTYHYLFRLDGAISIYNQNTSNTYYYGAFSVLSDLEFNYETISSTDFYLGCFRWTYTNAYTTFELCTIYDRDNNSTWVSGGTFIIRFDGRIGNNNINYIGDVVDGNPVKFDNTIYTFDLVSFEENYSNGYQNGYQDGLNAGKQQGYSEGYNVGYADGYNVGNTDGYNSGYSIGYDDGVLSQQQAITDSYNTGYADGYNEGFSADSTATTIFSGILQVAMVPINFFLAIFNFEILGINLSGFIRALFTVALTIIVVRTIFGGKGASEE